MENALYGISEIAVFVSEISLFRLKYVNKTYENTVRPHFPWSILYV